MATTITPMGGCLTVTSTWFKRNRSNARMHSGMNGNRTQKLVTATKQAVCFGRLAASWAQLARGKLPEGLERDAQALGTHWWGSRLHVLVPEQTKNSFCQHDKIPAACSIKTLCDQTQPYKMTSYTHHPTSNQHTSPTGRCSSWSTPRISSPNKMESEWSARKTHRSTFHQYY